MSVLVSRPVRSWRILLADQDTAAEQMAMDVGLAEQAGHTFRLFRWRRPAVSIGFKQRPPEWVEPARLAEQGIEVVERPTGGGVAVHGSDLSFSVIAPHDPQLPLRVLLDGIVETLIEAAEFFPGTHDLFLREVHGNKSCVPRQQFGIGELGVPAYWVHDAESRGRIDYCLTEQSPYALMTGDRKLCGLAVRRYPASWLVQGSLLVRRLPDAITKAMPPRVLAAFESRANSLEQAVGRPVEDVEVVGALTGAWQGMWGSR